jgi:predicted TIM-barrel fold metal-dependent hydrolase
MVVTARDAASQAEQDDWRRRLTLVDADVHHATASPKDLFPYLPRRYVEWIEGLGMMMPTAGFTNMPNQRPDLQAQLGRPEVASDPEFTARAHLDQYGVDRAILTGGTVYGAAVQPEPDYAAALCRAFNDYTLEHWVAKDRRYKMSISIAPQDPRKAVEEIERLADHPGVAQVIVPGGSPMPLGNRMYDPIWEAAAAHDLPVCCHFGSEGGGIAAPPTGAGYPATYIEIRAARPQVAQAHVCSLVASGLFERLPKLRFLFIEFHTWWVPGLFWQLDADWKSLRDYTPWVKRRPSEYLGEHLKFGSQPIEEPPSADDLARLLEWMRAEKTLVFCSDFPHWDWDEPTTALPSRLPAELRRRIFVENALELYGERLK